MRECVGESKRQKKKEPNIFLPGPASLSQFTNLSLCDEFISFVFASRRAFARDVSRFARPTVNKRLPCTRLQKRCHLKDFQRGHF